jgi:hypothetical protein
MHNKETSLVRQCAIAVMRVFDVHSPGTKRDFEGLPVQFYVSHGPSKKRGRDHLKVMARRQGKTAKALMRELCDMLNASPEDIEAALDTGDALRCWFLVPTTPGRNPTPDVLSAASWPDWVVSNGASTDDEHDSLFDTVDFETADVLAG